jgi:hypothetical protein
MMKLWLTVEEAGPYIGDDPQTIYRDIRENQFPFEYVKSGSRIKISARSIGLIPDFWWDTERVPRNSKEQPQGEVFQTTA